MDIKEQLQEIEEQKERGFYVDNPNVDDVNGDIEFLLSTIKSLQIERDRYREALEEYANKSNWVETKKDSDVEWYNRPPYDWIDIRYPWDIAQSALREE